MFINCERTVSIVGSVVVSQLCINTAITTITTATATATTTTTTTTTTTNNNNNNNF